MRKKLQGGCSCGNVRYQLLSAPIRVHCCHCTDCQRHTGSAFVINAIIETSAIKIIRGTLEAVPVPRTYAPHDIYRCRKCKVALWSNYGRRPQIQFVRVGTLDDPSAIRPDIHIYTRTKVPWLKLPKGKPAFKAYYDPKKVWPKNSLQRYKTAMTVRIAEKGGGAAQPDAVRRLRKS
ncbi:MAG TPA: GFA family protein [Candidatus Limnocylindrales bacterium]|nr:GFA family protein [Candidatus Limnocylindrales bacterium]